ncbi:recombination protein RecR [Brevibacterium ravenspurgense]|uniref:Recombination protein RecR n=1 Tax=Brevibacterium ravenspurgense TaxID=479117 RepID=A0A150HBK0_9MICO|nr:MULTISPECIES: recombination mediator RecR [Brevibacterium]KXZ59020.1 Recombination protein RecR [Brevibacterium ravenspurgense]OFT97333.1 recombination protein RecR [Brevibacterium sp. HMSC22B09]PKY71055.1 recombination protein RecR [Brevibacterium ravenspurgense]
MSVYEGALADLVEEFGKLPGIGPKSAQRLAFYVMQSPREDVDSLISALTNVKTHVRFCDQCGNVAEGELCSICSDPRRDSSLICVVEEPKDVVALERTREYRGLYHVLGGAIDPMSGIGPDDLRIRELLPRLQSEDVQECILATDPNLEGEATATYLIRLLSSIGVTVSKLASGLPVGGDLEYADEVTLGRAFQGRTKVS